jgi:hypothetical protein
MTRIALALLLAAAAGTTHGAGAIYKCGPDGKTYSQVPCAEGTLMDAADPRSAAQRAEAKRITAVERKAAADQERERKAADDKVAPSTASLAPMSAASGPETRKAGKRAKAAADRDLVATVPAARAASTSAR